MSKFAKLFDVADTQVLFILEEDEEGCPGVAMRTSISGITATTTCSFSQADGWDKSEKLFESLTQENADLFYGRMKKELLPFAPDEDIDMKPGTISLAIVIPNAE